MGFVKMSHDLKNWEWFKDKNTMYVYLNMILDANWADAVCKGVKLKRGQLIISQREYAEKCGITRQELRTILERLTSAHMITKTATRKFSIITMLEYDCATQETTRGAPANQPTSNPPTLLNKKEKNIRNQENARAREGGVESEELNLSFDRFWEKYPKKTAKQQALTAWKKLKPDEKMVEDIIGSLERQKKSVQWTKDNGQYIPYPATWLNGRRWEDELTEVNDYGIQERLNRTKEEWLGGFVPAKPRSRA